MNHLNSEVVVAERFVEGIQRACGDALSPSLVWGLGHWSGASTSLGDTPSAGLICESVVPSIALEVDRPAQMSRVYRQCSIESDGLFDETDFLRTSGPYAGVLASRLYAELSSRAVSGSRAVSLAHLVAGMSQKTRRNVYGDFASRLWRVPLQTASAPRLNAPSCTPIVVVAGDWVRWQDQEWHPMTESGVNTEAPTVTHPSFVSGNTVMGAWQSAQEECSESGNTVLLAIDSDLALGGVRALLWTLDGLSGYRPTMVVRPIGGGPPHELMPLGALPFRVVDVRTRLQNQQDGVFLLPESSAVWDHEFKGGHHESRMNSWLPGVWIQIDVDGWSLRVDDEDVGEGSEREPQAVLAMLAPHHEQIRNQGMILTVSDEIKTARFIAWLSALHEMTDRVWLDARSPDRTTVGP